MVEIEHLLLMQHFRVVYFRRVCIPRNLSDKWDIPQLYHEKGLHTCSYFISCHRKYNSQMGRLGVMQLNCTDRWEGFVEY